jgi:hypothetical protein
MADNDFIIRILTQLEGEQLEVAKKALADVRDETEKAGKTTEETTEKSLSYDVNVRKLTAGLRLLQTGHLDATTAVHLLGPQFMIAAAAIGVFKIFCDAAGNSSVTLADRMDALQKGADDSGQSLRNLRRATELANEGELNKVKKQVDDFAETCDITITKINDLATAKAAMFKADQELARAKIEGSDETPEEKKKQLAALDYSATITERDQTIARTTALGKELEDKKVALQSEYDANKKKLGPTAEETARAKDAYDAETKQMSFFDQTTRPAFVPDRGEQLSMKERERLLAEQERLRKQIAKTGQDAGKLSTDDYVSMRKVETASAKYDTQVKAANAEVTAKGNAEAAEAERKQVKATKAAARSKEDAEESAQRDKIESIRAKNERASSKYGGKVDQTELHKAERALKTMQEHFKALTDAIITANEGMTADEARAAQTQRDHDLH